MKTKNVKLYRNVEFDLEVIRDSSFSQYNYIELSKPLEIEFELLDHQDINNQEIDILRNKQSEIRAEMQSRVDQIEERIQELLALPSL